LKGTAAGAATDQRIDIKGRLLPFSKAGQLPGACANATSPVQVPEWTCPIFSRSKVSF